MERIFIPLKRDGRSLSADDCEGFDLETGKGLLQVLFLSFFLIKKLLEFLKLGTGNARLTRVGIIFNDLLQKQLGAHFVAQVLKRYSLF